MTLRRTVNRFLFFMMVISIPSPSLTETSSPAIKTFVFVHGAWVGEWYWTPIIKQLQQRGHKTYVVSLRGHGLRASESSADVTIDDHINDVIDAVLKRDLHNVFLVAHSYGGRPATGAWDQLRDRVHHIVYIDAIAPTKEGKIAIPQDDAVLSMIEERFPKIGQSGMLPVRPGMPEAMRSRSMPQSLKTLYAAVHLEHGPLPDTTARTFILAEQNPSPFFKRVADSLREDERWRVLTLDSRHDVASDAPGQLARILEKLE